jgi:FG-GAP-like repeat
MKLNISRSGGLASWGRAGLAFLFVLVALVRPSPVAAQISKSGPSKPVIPGGTNIGSDVAYDPVHQVYLVVSGYGIVRGVFVNTAGDAVTAPFQFGSANGADAAYASYPRVAFSQEVNGGQGGFLVAWNQTGQVRSVVLSYRSGLISGEALLSDPTLSARGGSGLSIAYSRTSRRFLVAWTSALFGIQARFVDTAGTAFGGVIPLTGTGGYQFPALAWNPATDEFGFALAGWSGATSYVAFQKLRGSDAAPTTRLAPFGQGGGTFCTDLTVNTSTNAYMMGWSVGGGSRAVQFDWAGNMIGAPTLVSSRVGTPTSYSHAYNPASGTFIAVSEDAAGTVQAVATELSGSGTPTGIAMGMTDGAARGSFAPRVATRTDGREWNISFARDFTAVSDQVVVSASAGGGGNPPPPPPPPPTGLVRPDITIYRPSEGTWYSLLSSSNFTQYQAIRWGLAGDIPLNADFDGDGRLDRVVYGPSEGRWSVLHSSTNFDYTRAGAASWGIPGDIPVPSDFDGDRRADLAVFRPTNGTWYIRFSASGYSLSNYQAIPWGLPGDIPLQADFNGDGRADLVVYRPSTGTWHVLYAYYGYEAATAYHWGLPGDIPMAEDFDGDGKTDLAVYRPSTGYWYVRYSSSNYSYSNWAAFAFGSPGDVPIRGDYDADGKADVVVYRPSNANWYFLLSSTGYDYRAWRSYGWGLAFDMPVGGK